MRQETRQLEIESDTEAPSLRASRFGSQVALTLMTNLLVSAIGLMTGSLTARLLGPAGRGDLASIQVWGSFVATIALCGLADSVIYFSSRDTGHAGQYWMSGTYCSLLCGIPALLVGNWVVSYALRGQSETVTAMLPWYTPAFFFLFALSSLSLGALRGSGRFSVWNTLRIFPQLGWALVVVYAIVCRQTTVSWLVSWFLVSYAVTTCVIIVTMLRQVPVSLAPQVSLWPQLLRYGFPSVTGNIPGQLMQSGRIAQLFLAVFLNPAALGLLAVGVALGDAIRIIPVAIASVVFPRVAAVQADQQRVELIRSTRLTVLLTGICATVAIVTCPLTVPFFFGASFQDAVPSAMLLAVGGSIEGMKIVLGGGIRGLGRPSAILTSEAIAVVSTVVSLIFLLPVWGVTGAALALTIGNLPAAFLLIRVAKDLTSCSSRYLLLPTLADLRLVLTSTVRGWGVMRAVVIKAF